MDERRSLIEENRFLNKRSIISVSACSVALVLFLAAFPVVRAQPTNFSITATPTLLCVNPGIDGRFTITLTSTGGPGTVNLSDSIDPVRTNGPTLASIPSTANLSHGQPYHLDLTVSTLQNSPTGAYTINVYAISGQWFHQTTTTLVVSNNCSVGGTILPTSNLGMPISATVLTASIAGIAIVLAVSAIIYSGQRKRSTDR
jgi:hypothetical protein